MVEVKLYPVKEAAALVRSKFDGDWVPYHYHQPSSAVNLSQQAPNYQLHLNPFRRRSFRCDLLVGAALQD
jgi:hypothetical protein